MPYNVNIGRRHDTPPWTYDLLTAKT